MKNRLSLRLTLGTLLPAVWIAFSSGHAAQAQVVGPRRPAPQVVYPDWVPLINVRDFGATGDGKTDDTAAIQRAIQSKKQARQLYFPAGTYLVSKPLVSLDSDGAGQAWLQLYGSGRDHTTIRLADGAADFRDAADPVALIQFRAAREPVNGRRVEQPNVAFFNSIYDMTIDVGAANPGAVGVDWIVCNAGSLRRVAFRSSDPQLAGFAGVRMHRNDGTSFMRDVTVTGFDYGWWRGGNAQSMAAEGLYLAGQRKAGIYNQNSVLVVHDLMSDNRVPTLVQAEGTAQASVLNARVTGGAPAAFVQEHPAALLYLRDVSAAGSRSLVRPADGTPNPPPGGSALTGEWFSHPPASSGPAASLRLPIKVAPESHDNDPSTWALVSRFPDDGTGDYSVRLQKAIDSGARTIVMDASGTRKYKSQVTVRGKVRRIVGFWQSSLPASDAEAKFVRTYGHGSTDKITAALDDPARSDAAYFMRIEGLESDVLTIEQFHHFPGAILNDSPSTLVLRDMPVVAYVNTARATGDLFTEGAMGAKFRIGHGQRAWLRSVDAVFGSGPDILADGTTVTVLSNRTEGGGAFVEAANGARVEVISSSHFIGSHGVGADVAYVTRDSDLALINFSETGFVRHGVYQTLVVEKAGDRETRVDRKGGNGGVFKRNNLNKVMLYRATRERK